MKRDPLAVPRYLIGGEEALIRSSLARTLGSDHLEFRREFTKPIGPLGQVFDEVKRLPYLGWIRSSEILYVAVRALQPTVVVETGVAAGLSSACILAALKKNGAGELHSIDLPDQENAYFPALGVDPIAILPQGKAPGFLVPETLRSRWHLHLGDTREVLPKLLSGLRAVDIFLHDSEHTYQAMTFEYETVWSHLRPGGLLLSDDVSWNTAFPDFCRRRELKPVYFWRTGLGGVVKPTMSPLLNRSP